MTEAAFAVLALLVIGWTLTSHVLLRANIGDALFFMVAGYVLANPEWGPLGVDVESAPMRLLAELTLAMLLFVDASRIDITRLRADIRIPARLLLIGTPLSVILGSVLAAWFVDGLPWALALFVGATLAPTDAALSTQVINDGRISRRVRRTLNVESGLNDGLVTPVVTFALVVAASELGVGSGTGSPEGRALLDLVIGSAVGVGIGLGTAALLTVGSRRRWIVAEGKRLATLSAALASFALAGALHGNGFIAAFIAGMAFGAALPADVAADEVSEPLELLGELSAFAVWFLFGAGLLPLAIDRLSVSSVGYAVLSLTAIRIAAVSTSLWGAGLDRATVLFVGWFGPRGLASVVFALVAVEELGESSVVGDAVGLVALTVALSVLLHGLTAEPLGRRYVVRHGADGDQDAGPVLRTRRRAHSGAAAHL